MRAMRRVEPPTSTERKVPDSEPLGREEISEGSIVAEFESLSELDMVSAREETIDFRVWVLKDEERVSRLW